MDHWLVVLLGAQVAGLTGAGLRVRWQAVRGRRRARVTLSLTLGWALAGGER